MNTTSVLLEPLGGDDVSQLVANLLRSQAVPRAVEQKIAEAAEGNPLFVEEFLAMLLDDRVIQRAGGKWVSTANLEAIRTPDSIMSLLSARLDQLPHDERLLLERAAVIGKVFTHEEIEAAGGEIALGNLEQLLESLVRREIIRPGVPARSDAYRFKHILIRDAAYTALPKKERAEIHARFADFLERTAGDRMIEFEEVIGYHLEQSAQYWHQLGIADEGDSSAAEAGSAVPGCRWDPCAPTRGRPCVQSAAGTLPGHVDPADPGHVLGRGQ